MKKIIELKDICYRYDRRKTDGITDLSFTIFQSECLCLVGPSGSGKTTTAKIIADKLSAQSGEIKIFENTKTAYVPQNSELPSESTVFEYLKSTLTDLEDEKKENLIRANLLLLGISNEMHNPISSISGGQRQRVIIASALIQNPNLIILDEPFGHLDEKLRSDLMDELFTLFKDQAIACLWVTHEIKEALSFSDRIILLNYGVIQQASSPTEIYQKPQNLFTAEFFGRNNTIIGQLKTLSDQEIGVKVLNQEIIIPRPKEFKDKNQQEVLLIIRPEHIHLEDKGKFKGKVKKVHFQGAYSLVEAELSDGFYLILNVDGHHRLNYNDKIQFNIDYTKVYCLDEV